MGNCCLRCRRFKNRVGNMRRRKIVLLLVGLDNSGKTTAARGLAGEDQNGIVPTVGFSAQTLNYEGYSVVIYDLGGGPQIRGIWPEYYVDAHGVIFIVDSSDVARLDECRRILEELLAHDKLSGKPVLLLANKQDKPGALDEIDIVDKLNVEGIVNKHRCPTLVETCSALCDPSKKTKDRLDPGIQNGYRWLLTMIIKDFPKFDARVERDTLAAQEQLNREKEERRKRLSEEQKKREEDENSRIIPLRDDAVEVVSIDGEDVATGEEAVTADNRKTDSSAEDIEDITNKSKTRFIDLDGDEISLITNGSNDSGLHTLVNGSYNENKQSSKDTMEQESDAPVEQVKIQRRVNGFIESVPAQELSPVFKEYTTDVLREPPPKKSLLKKSNKTGPAPLGSLLTDVVIDRRRLPPLASPPPIQMFEIAPIKRPLPARSMSMSDDFRGSTKTMTSTVEEYEPSPLKKMSESSEQIAVGDTQAA